MTGQVNDPRWAEVRERDEIVALEHSLLTVPPCPTWCTTSSEHSSGYDSIDLVVNSFSRFHRADFGGHICIRQLEENRDGAVTLHPATIDVEEDLELDATGARQLAASLLDAAERYDEILATQR